MEKSFLVWGKALLLFPLFLNLNRGERVKKLPLFRCYNCEKVLGRIQGKAEIKCPRCRALNIISNSTHMGIRMKPAYRKGGDQNKKHSFKF